MGKSKHVSPAASMGHPSTNKLPAFNGMPAFGLEQDQAQELNNAIYQFYYDWLLQLACSRFEWQGLPNSIDVRYLEMTLNGFGLAALYFDEDYNEWFGLRATPNGKINPYHNPTRYIVYGSNGYHKNVSARDMIPIWNNYTRTPTAFALQVFAWKLSNIDRTISINLAQQRNPPIITCTEEQRLTLETMLQKAYGGQPVVLGDQRSLSGIGLTYLTNPVPYIGDKLAKDKAIIWCEIMTYLGIDNTAIEKPERVQTAEVQANDSQVQKSGLVYLDERRRSCEEFNRYQNDYKIWVDMATDWSTSNFAALMALPSERIENE